MTRGLVSFDVWDTLLRRHCDPETVKLSTCRHLLLLHPDAVDQRWWDVGRLWQLRHRIEIGLVRAARRQGFDGEYRLEEVLDALVRRVARADLPKVRAEEIAAELRRVEVAQEAFVTYRDPVISAVIAEHAGARLAFLSDFHLSTPEVASLLRQNGLGEIAELGFVSADVRLNKKSGRLFEHVRKVLSAEAAEWLHIGDDWNGDVLSPMRAGIRSQHYVPHDEEVLRREKEALLGRPLVVLHRAGLKLVEDAGADQGEAGHARILGQALSPLVAGYGLWLVEQIARHRPDRLIFTGACAELLAAANGEIADVFGGAVAPVKVVVCDDDGALGQVAADETVAIVAIRTSTSRGGWLAQQPARATILQYDLCHSSASDRRLSGQRPEQRFVEEGMARPNHIEAIVGGLARCHGSPTDAPAETGLIEALRSGIIDGVGTFAREFRTHAITSAEVRAYAMAVCAKPLRLAASMPIDAITPDLIRQSFAAGPSFTARANSLSLAGFTTVAWVRGIRRLKALRQALAGAR